VTREYHVDGRDENCVDFDGEIILEQLHTLHHVVLINKHFFLHNKFFCLILQTCELQDARWQ
jgi:hypothetical protein